MFSAEDKSLLRRIFNPNLSDRRDEGDCFIPPDTSFAYVQKLRALVKEEEAAQQKRRDHFLSKEFVASAPGPLFPSSWASTVDINMGDRADKHGLHARPDYLSQSYMFDQALKSAVPEFDKTAEDGTRYRIYRLGSLEVRTCQSYDDREVIGMVFSRRAQEASKGVQMKDTEKIVKASEYVEKSGKNYHCYTILETDHKNLLTFEELSEGLVKKEENPADLEDRNSLARILRSAECSQSNMTVKDVRQCQENVYSLVSGDEAASGFRAP